MDSNSSVPRNPQKASGGPGEATPLQVDELVRVYGKDGCSEILSLFPDEMRGLLEQAPSLIDREDSKELARIAHQIKGLAAFVICPHMETLGRQLETSAQQCEWQDARQTCIQLGEWFAGVIVFINQLLPSISG